MSVVWGVVANSHDASVAVFIGGKLVFASHTERFSGIKNDPNLNHDIIQYALRWGKPSQVVWYEKPWLKLVRQCLAGQRWHWNDLRIAHELKSKWGIDAPIKYISHHHSHAAAGFFTSGFRDATVIVMDSIGELETMTIWKGNGNHLQKIYSHNYPDSMGLFYSAMTQRVKLKPNEDEYILMGMSAYGDPRRFENEMYSTFFADKASLPCIRQKYNFHRGCSGYNHELVAENDYFDIAAATQCVFTRMLVKISDWARVNLPSKNLVFVGGCALNCVANSVIASDWNQMWVYPNPGDAGSSVGAVLAYLKQHIEWNHCMWGYVIKGPYPVDAVLQELLVQGICGVANGAAEFGPRALGNRSLLADPRGVQIKDRVNSIKKRQMFRPFSPAILEEHALNYFVMHSRSSQFMSFIAKCKSPELYPAIIHVDGTSRVQTVPKDGSGFRQLLERWYETTGCPMLLNTSLNIKGKPICNTETDAKEFSSMYNVTVFT